MAILHMRIKNYQVAHIADLIIKKPIALATAVEKLAKHVQVYTMGHTIDLRNLC